MDRTHTVGRRRFMIGLATTSTIAVAGCSGDDTSSFAPDEDADPEELLPDPPAGWEMTFSQEQAAGLVGAEAGYAADYEDPDGNQYDVEILRWSSQREAENDEYPSQWSVHVAIGNFTFAGMGSDTDDLIMLMSNTSALTEEYIRENNNQ